MLSYTALFASLALLAAVPSVSVLLVVTLAAEGGFRRGAAGAAGVVAGDVVLITIALFGLSVVGSFPPLVSGLLKVAAGAWLCYLAVEIGRTRVVPTGEMSAPPGLGSAFGAGLLLTLSDHKAVIFYLGFLPGFLEVETVTILEWVIVVGITCVAVGGVKLLYVVGAGQARLYIQSSMGTIIRQVGGIVVAVVGIGIIANGLMALWR